VEEGVIRDEEWGVAAADEADPWPADAHDAGEGDLFLRVEGVVEDGGFEGMGFGEYFCVANCVGASYVEA